MTKKIKRNIIKNIFLNFEKEETWLNHMSLQGYSLKEISNGYYIFETCEPGEYIYRIEFLDREILNNREQPSYLNFLKEMQVDHVASINRWQYFKRESSLGDFEIYSDIDSKISHYKCVFKKEDKKDQEVRGGAVSSSGMYSFRYMSSREASQRRNSQCHFYRTF